MPITAIILSAGRSSRMGAFKPLLPLGNSTVVKQAVNNFRQAGIRDVQVVLGKRAADVVSHLDGMGVSWIVNQDFHKDMLTSVRLGVRRLRPEARAFFVLPVDIPLVRSRTISMLMRKNSDYPGSILYPVFSGTRGHPPLIPRPYAAQLSAYHGEGGLKGFLRQHEHGALDIPVADQGVLMDMDTPEQYERIRKRFRNWRLPSEAECLAMLAFRFENNDPMLQHADTVAGLAQCIAAELRAAGVPIDVELAAACGYLHDIGKGMQDHAQVGAEMLVNFGYPQIAAIVATHMDLKFNAADDITEREVLFLADKKTSGGQIMALDERLSVKLKQLADNPDGRAAVQKRLGTAMQIQQRIERILGREIDELCCRKNG